MSQNLTLESALQAIVATQSDRSPTGLAGLIAALRPHNVTQINLATNSLRSLAWLLDQNAAYRSALRHYLMKLVSSRRQLHLYTDAGILSNEGVWSAFRRRLGEKLLPSEYRDDYLRDLFGRVFDHKDDYEWVNAVPDAVWLEVWQALNFAEGNHAHDERNTQLELVEAAQVLSYRISAIGLEPELVRNYPAIEKFESPFLTQNVELRDYLEGYKAQLIEPSKSREDDKAVCVLLDQCDEIVMRVRKTSAHEGVSVSLTYLMVRLSQHLERLRLVLDLLEQEHSRQTPERAVRFFKQLVEAENRKTSLRDLFATNTDLLALQITEHAGRTGEHYIASNRREWLAMAKSAMGAGFIVGFMALLKIFTAKLKLAPLIEAFAFSMNYSLGFMLIHMLHFTIATKQPAMTAAKIAASIERQSKAGDAQDGLVELIEAVARTQFVAIMGNVLIAIPTALLIALSLKYGLDSEPISTEKAYSLLHDLDPFHSLAIPHAAIAGCCLFLAGLISGYYDNKAVYNRIPARLMQLQLPRRLFGEARWQRICTYIENNLGALAGNFFFGIMLGSMGTLGFLLGLPLDIRHITFSSANLAYAAVALDFQLPWQIWLTSSVGVLLIGLTNLAVSFGLALSVALRSRRIRFVDRRSLVRKLFQRLLRSPQRFFIAPKEIVTATPNHKPEQ
ncbi:site-specific recombinase [Chitinimonas sp. BJB300]|uniref:site-specific recombinase n=1 Tax=Chitinimonas sp. BJB300 TaxID=1559339 RepID=UPI000C0DA176|nr:site-specific recombinase [Chitinimonas sp. BJB300]PHV11137.1 recombinase [Chitinimonas sp. BJB300]TSJ90974.1 recombinase [Chitinimonas sp. BJB300]